MLLVETFLLVRLRRCAACLLSHRMLICEREYVSGTFFSLSGIRGLAIRLLSRVGEWCLRLQTG